MIWIALSFVPLLVITAMRWRDILRVRSGRRDGLWTMKMGDE